MKSKYILIIFFISLGMSSQNNITFNVDMSEYKDPFNKVYISGDFNNWSGNQNPMVSSGGDIWSITLNLPNGFYKYKFTLDNNATQENLNPGDVCVLTDNGVSTRFLVVEDENLLLNKTLFNSCYEKGQDSSILHNTTIKLDMTQFTNNFDTVFISGTFNGWSGLANPLVNSGNGIWVTTLSLPENMHEFKFTVDDWTYEEEFDSGDFGTVTNEGQTNRFISINKDQTVSYLWNETNNSEEEEEIIKYDIVFNVDMSEYEQEFNTPYVSGTFNGWSGEEHPMTDFGNGIWSTTISLADGEYKYKFTIDNWLAQEDLNSGEVCVLTDGGFTTRGFIVSGEDKTLSTPLFNSCYGSGENENGPYEITFKVNMNDYSNPYETVYVSAVFNGWSGVENPMTNLGNGIWSVTLLLPESTKEFKFTHDDWAGQENFSPGDLGTVTNGGFTNRYISINTNKIVSYNWNESGFTEEEVEVEEEEEEPEYEITFKVNTNFYQEPFTTMFLSGDFNNWSGTENPMIDMGDGIWSTTISLADGNYKYKFTYDDWAGQENLSSGDVCVVTDGGFTTRGFTVSGSDKVLSSPLFDSCYSNGENSSGPHDITFNVDMSNYAGNFETVYVSGNFNAWSGVENPMTDVGNGIWSVTLSLPESTKEFKFTYDDWAGQENFSPGDLGTVTNGGFTNRYISINEMQTRNYVWAAGGSTLNLDKKNDNLKFNVWPNPSNDYWNISVKKGILKSINVYDISGKKIKIIAPNSKRSIIEINSLNIGIYYATIQTNLGNYSIKLIKI